VGVLLLACLHYDPGAHSIGSAHASRYWRYACNLAVRGDFAQTRTKKGPDDPSAMFLAGDRRARVV